MGVAMRHAFGFLVVLLFTGCRAVTPQPPPPPPEETEIEIELPDECPLLVPMACCEGEVCELPPDAELGQTVACAAPRAPDKCPCIPGFEALGVKGTKCDVDGPASKGNGTSETLENSCYKVELKVKTGYIDATFTITRTASPPCKDTMAVKGSLYNTKTKKMVKKDSSAGATITYDCDEKEGKISVPDGKGGNIEYPYSTDGGELTIELSGYDHDFEDCKPPPP